jgi:hypothetical protein
MAYWTAKYLAATCAYGAISALPQAIWKTHRKYVNPETYVANVLPIPFTERCGFALFKVCVSPGCWPLILYKDLTLLELYCKGIDPRQYGLDPDSDLL